MLTDEPPLRSSFLVSITNTHPDIGDAVHGAIELVAGSLQPNATKALRTFNYNESRSQAEYWIADLFAKEHVPPGIVGWNFGVGDYTEELPLYCLYLAGYETLKLNGRDELMAEYGWLPDRRIMYDQYFFQEVTQHCAYLPEGVGLFLCKTYAISLAIKLGPSLARILSVTGKDCIPITCSIDGVDEVMAIGGLTQNGIGPLPIELLK